MLCTGEFCDRKQRCSLYYANPQPEYRKFDNIESLATHGWGGITDEGEWDCGPWGSYKMFTPIPDQMLFEKIAAEINAYGFGVNVAPENIRALVEQFKRRGKVNESCS